MPRLFTGIEIPAALRLRLSILGAPLNGARWIKPDNMHITLCFAGDIDDNRADDWAHQLAMIDAEEFDISIRGLGTFGSASPKLIWAGLDAGGSLETLHQAHSRAARAVGIEIDNRRYKPHITLARLHRSNAAAVAQYISENAGLSFERFPVERTVLFSSRPGKGGGPYAIEDSYPLQQRWRAYDNDNEDHDAERH